MAYNNASSAPSFFSAAQAPATQSAENWRSTAYVNIFLPRKDGESRKKLGAIAFQGNDQEMQTLQKWLTEDPSKTEKRLQYLIDQLVMEFHVVGQNSSGFDLPDNL